MKVVCNALSKFFVAFLLFSLIFYFVVPGFRNTLIFTVFLSLLLFPIWINAGLRFFKPRRLLSLAIIYFFPVIYSFGASVVSYSYDFSIINISTLAVVYYFSLYFASCFIYIVLSKKSMDLYFECLFYMCVLQAIVILVAMFSPEFRSVVSQFQDPLDTEISSSIGGSIRGFALSAQQYFGLSSTFCFLFLFIGFYFVNINACFFKIAVLVLVFFVSITAGRTVFVGFIFLIILIAICGEVRFRISFFLKMLTCIGLFVLIGFLFLKDTFDEKMINWAFELFINLGSSGKLESQSSNELLDKMLFIPDVITLIFGSGMYTNPDGSYFGHTDSGFMRGILAIGVPYCFFIIFDTAMFYYICDNLKRIGYKYTNQLFFVSISMSIILNVKGEFFGYVIMPHVVIVLTLFISSLFVKNKNHICHVNSN